MADDSDSFTIDDEHEIGADFEASVPRLYLCDWFPPALSRGELSTVGEMVGEPA